jgi:hypothetical protein
MTTSHGACSHSMQQLPSSLSHRSHTSSRRGNSNRRPPPHTKKRPCSTPRSALAAHFVVLIYRGWWDVRSGNMQIEYSGNTMPVPPPPTVEQKRRRLCVVPPSLPAMRLSVAWLWRAAGSAGQWQQAAGVEVEALRAARAGGGAGGGHHPHSRFSDASCCRLSLVRLVTCRYHIPHTAIRDMRDEGRQLQSPVQFRYNSKRRATGPDLGPISAGTTGHSPYLCCNGNGNGHLPFASTLACRGGLRPRLSFLKCDARSRAGCGNCTKGVPIAPTLRRPHHSEWLHP